MSIKLYIHSPGQSIQALCSEITIPTSNGPTCIMDKHKNMMFSVSKGNFIAKDYKLIEEQNAISLDKDDAINALSPMNFIPRGGIAKVIRLVEEKMTVCTITMY